MLYANLDKSARYSVRIVYGAESKADVKLVANGKYEIQPDETEEYELLT